MTIGVEHHAVMMGIVGFHAKGARQSNPAASAASVPPVYKPQINPLLAGVIALRRAVTRESRAKPGVRPHPARRQTRHSRRGPPPGYNLKTAPPSVLPVAFMALTIFRRTASAGGFETNASTSLFSSALGISSAVSALMPPTSRLRSRPPRLIA